MKERLYFYPCVSQIRKQRLLEAEGIVLSQNCFHLPKGRVRARAQVCVTQIGRSMRHTRLLGALSALTSPLLGVPAKPALALGSLTSSKTRVAGSAAANTRCQQPGRETAWAWSSEDPALARASPSGHGAASSQSVQ